MIFEQKYFGDVVKTVASLDNTPPVRATKTADVTTVDPTQEGGITQEEVNIVVQQKLSGVPTTEYDSGDFTGTIASLCSGLATGQTRIIMYQRFNPSDKPPEITANNDTCIIQVTRAGNNYTSILLQDIDTLKMWIGKYVSSTLTWKVVI